MWSNKTHLESVEIPELLISSRKLNIGITVCKIGAANYGVFTFAIVRIGSWYNGEPIGIVQHHFMTSLLAIQN